MVDSIDGLTASGKISKEFVSIILLPIVGNAAGQWHSARISGFYLWCVLDFAEHVTAVTVSVKDKLTLSIGVAVGSSIVSCTPLEITIVAILIDYLLANRPLCYSVHDHACLDIGKALDSSFRSLRVRCALPRRLVCLVNGSRCRLTKIGAVLTVNYTVQDGKSNWLEGMILMCTYLITLSTGC